MSGQAHVEVFPEQRVRVGEASKGKQTEWRWRLRAANGEIVAQSEGYVSESNARAGVEAAWQAARDVQTEQRGGRYTFPTVEAVES